MRVLETRKVFVPFLPRGLRCAPTPATYVWCVEITGSILRFIRPLRRRERPFPFLSDLLQADAAQFELDAQPAQDGRFVLKRLVVVFAGAHVRARPLLAISHQLVLVLG